MSALTEKILALAKEAGLDEAAQLPIAGIYFNPDFYFYCKQNRCGAFGKNWACPQSEDIAGQWNEKIKDYKYAFLVETKGVIPDSEDFEVYRELHVKHHLVFRSFVASVRAMGLQVQPFSAEACSYCKKCTCPDAPCRFPDLCFSAIEGVGLNVQELCKAGNIPYGNFRDFVTFVSLLLIS